MQLARYLDKLFQKDGFVLVDANSNKYIIGSPKKNDPITVKILDKKLHYKLFFRPDLYFGEAYSNGDIKIKKRKFDWFFRYSTYEYRKRWIKSF